MAKEKTNLKDPAWQRWHALATKSTVTLHIYTWTCPDCKTMNKTRIDPSDEATRFRYYRGVEARCGHCHGNKKRLVDSKGWTFDPSDLTTDKL
jgi:hypothetical protein